MNYYKPLEIADKKGKGTGKWRYTRRNNNEIMPHPCCIEWEHPLRDPSKPNKIKELHYHDSPEEASKCYREYCIKKGCTEGGMPIPSEWYEKDYEGIEESWGSY